MDRQLIDQAIEHHQAGRYEQAASLYTQILESQPDQVDALHLLGVLAYQDGDAAKAVALVGRAIEQDSSQSVFHNMMGLALLDLGRLEEAEASLLTAIDRDPGSAQAHHNLGKVLMKADRLRDAVDSFTLAAGIDPKYANPNYLLGDALQSLGELDSAIASYDRALELDGRIAGAWYGKGCAQSSLGDYAAAVESFRQAIELDANHGEAHHNLGQAMFKLGQVEQAMSHLGTAETLLGQGSSQAAIATIIPGSLVADHWAIVEARRAWAQRFACAEGAGTDGGSQRQAGARRGGGERLRVGYVCSFFQDRNWMKPVWGLINHHDRSGFEVHLFSDAPLADVQYGLRQKPGDGYHDISGLSNEQAAELIRANKLDLLIDLNGYSRVERLGVLAFRPAPVIAGWFNHFATTGMDSFDYLIGDEHVIPEPDAAYYTEKIVRVPGSYLTFEVGYPVPDVAAPPCLAGKGVTFGSLAPQYKITTQVIEVWSRILQGCPDSSLMIKNRALGRQHNRAYVLRLFEACGVKADRVVLEGGAEHFAYLQAYDRIDIALDTFPYSGGTTTMESLWQGVPVLTYWGDRWVARTSSSLLRGAGLGQWVADDLDGYVKLAVELAKSSATPQQLNKTRLEMRSRLQQSAVCDTAGFASAMEAVYQGMCGQGPG